MRTILVFACLLLAVSVSAEIHVPADQPTVAAALAVAGVGETITVSPGVYHENDLGLPDGLVLRGSTGDPADVILDGGGVGPIIDDDDTQFGLSMSGLTLRNAQGAYGSALSLFLASDIQIEDCVFTSNSGTGGGGAIFVERTLGGEGTQLRIERCTFSDNTAISSGGAIFANVVTTLRDCVFLNNESTNSTGGAVGHLGGDLLVADCRFEDNTSRLSGGGVHADGGTTRLQGSTFLRNSVNTGSGGGASVTYGVVGGCTFEQNTAGYHGAGLEASPLVLLASSTFRDNEADQVGGGALISGGAVENCLFEGNHAGSNGGGCQGAGATVRFEACTWTDNTAGTRGGSFSSITPNASITFDHCSFSGGGAPNGPEGWIASSGTATLICCSVDPARWAEGTVTVDDAQCEVPAEIMSFGDIKLQFR